MRYSELVEDFRSAPFVRLLLPLCVGIIVQADIYRLPVDAAALCVGCFALMLCTCRWPASYGKRWCFGVVANLFLFFVGVAATQGVRRESALPLGQHLYVAAVVDDDPVAGARFTKLHVRVSAYRDSAGAWRSADEKMLLYVRNGEGATLPALGDKLAARIRPNPHPTVKNPYEFDYGAYQRQRGVFASAFVDVGSYAVVSHDNLPAWKTLPKQLRKKLLGYFAQQGLSGEELAVLQALTLGDKSMLDADLRQSYAAAGAMHILAVSGLHVGLISMMLGFCLRFMNRRKYGRVLRGLIVLLVIWSYALVAGCSPSVLRASIMFTVLTIGQMLNRYTNTYNTLAFSAFLICVFDPLSLFDAGFQLSYVAVLSILFFHPRIYRLLSFKRWLPDAVWSLTTVSVAANIGTFPIATYLFHQFPTHFILTNMLVTIPTTAIMGGFLLTAIAAFIPSASLVGGLLVTLTGYCIALLNYFVRFVERLPMSLLEALWVTPLQTWLLLLFVVAGALYVWTKRVKLLMLSLTLLVACLSLRAVQKYEQQQSRIMAVYCVKNSSLIAFISGRQGFALCDSADLQSSFSFNVKSHMASLGFPSMNALGRVALQQCDSMVIAEKGICKSFVSFAGETVKILRDEAVRKPPQPLEVSYLVHTSSCKLKPKQVAAIYRPQLLIIDSSMPAYLAARLRRDYEEMGIACHNVHEKGAFVHTF
ncbi:MAG: ComEC family competence protein [Prevotellaceae bacterium]|jgi:competence protein ComEC|nr:ComEC family competence protein [Prevotellaceae bacterium]